MRIEKEQAIELRRKGKTYREIYEVLRVPKSTLSGWLRDVKIPDHAKQELMSKARRAWAKNITRYNKARAVSARRNSLDAQKRASLEIGRLNGRELELIGASLYWAEGSKTDRWTAIFSNSDPSVITIMMRFFREVCGVTDDRFTLRLHVHQNISESEAKKYWSKLTRLSPNRFQKTQTTITKSSKGRRKTNTLPYGTLHIMVHDVNVVNRIKGWIQGISQA